MSLRDKARKWIENGFTPAPSPLCSKRLVIKNLIQINQLLEDREKAHDEYDKLWYNRIIQELDWVQQAQGRKFRRNCYMETEDAITLR